MEGDIDNNLSVNLVSSGHRAVLVMLKARSNLGHRSMVVWLIIHDTPLHGSFAKEPLTKTKTNPQSCPLQRSIHISPRICSLAPKPLKYSARSPDLREGL
jgi:hypothetical protein